MLPKKAFNQLKNKLIQIANEIERLNELKVYNLQNKNLNQSNRQDIEARLKNMDRNLELTIREAFLKFMVSILQNYKTFQRTLTRRPDIKAIDRNLSKFFDCEGSFNISFFKNLNLNDLNCFKLYQGLYEAKKCHVNFFTKN